MQCSEKDRATVERQTVCTPLRRTAPALGLFFLAPLTAEYLIGYGESVGEPVELLAGLLILGPLYGGPALLIREIARRSRRGWPTMILLAGAFGLVEAGLVDQSLFNISYGAIDDWEESGKPTFIPALGISAHMAMIFVAGHVVWSICAPIAVVEALVPGRSATPWLRNVGLTISGVLYVLASALVFFDHQETEQFLASPPQMIGTGIVAAALIGAAFVAGRRRSPTTGRPAPSPRLVGVTALATSSLYTLLPPTWPGLAAASTLLAATAVVIARLSRRSEWSALHRLALAGGALLSYAWLAFLVEPLGDPPIAAKLLHNTVLELGVVALLALGARRLARTQGPD